MLVKNSLDTSLPNRPAEECKPVVKPFDGYENGYNGLRKHARNRQLVHFLQ